MTTYITTPIFYVNAPPHLGHAYSTIVADTYARFKRLCGDDVRFQTGTDEHGDKIVQAAERAGESPQAYVDRISALFRESWPPLEIAPDNFIRTTDPDHLNNVQAILQKVYDQGDIYFSEYEGLYCQGCERFLTEKELIEGNCPDHLKPPAKIREQNYFFKMSKYQDWLIDHINSHPEFITPERYKNEMLSFLSEPLEDLCISRPTSRLTWGIPLPFDNNFVTYVWFDALINYLSGLGYPDDEKFARYWPVAEHVIAKDILKPHAIFWPTMLKAMGLAPYKKLHVHGYWNMGDAKMSKSLGNVVRPHEMVEEFGADVVRYFLLRDMSFGLDSSFSADAVVVRQNSDLANDLGNLFSRSLTMVGKFVDGKVPAPGEPREIDTALAQACTAMIATYQKEMSDFRFHLALQAVWEVVSKANKYIVENAPWDMVKNDEQKHHLDTVFYYLLECLRIIALAVEPIMPAAAAKMRIGLGVANKGALTSLAQWGGLTPGTDIAKPEPLFPRMEKKKDGHKDSAPKEAKADKDDKKKLEGVITFEDFGKVELRVAEIIAAEKVKKSDRLLKLTVRAPEERTIVAGIAEFYQPEDLPGRRVIIVANLKPAKLMGITSQGMVLAAKDGDRLVLSSVSAEVAPGSRVA
ncbi:MAG: methionine--tRNA ligase [Proteobacteria bacterium]|nr:methionine--tRNA ligase [Pseudomonadota bacterium]MBU1641220.1 methionine--tRNA ligase [Pseudomonadota bacterium]